MKPFHVGLLVIGAALAGGLAVKMTQPPIFHAAVPAPAVTAKPTPPATVPIPAQPESAAPAVSAPVATAPPAVYEKPKPAPAPAAKIITKAATAKPAPPVQIAKSEVPPKPPVPYQATPVPAASAPESPQNAPEPPAQTIPQPVPAYQSAPVAPTPPAPSVALQVILRQGTQIAVRPDQSLSSDHLSPGDTFQASLAEPLVVDGYIIAERGSRASGRIVDSRKAGRLNGTSDLQLALSSFQTADGQKISISTEPWTKEGNSSRGQDVAKIGGGAALGAIIGAIAGGGKGAAIGAGVGGVAGTGAAAATRGKPVTIPTETVIRFRLANRVTVTERPL